MRVRCPAKINLDLRVGPVRADGFHPIRSWFVTAGIFDQLEFADADVLSLACDDPAVPADARNLVWRAADALRAAAGQPGRGVAIKLSKAIPAGAGLGGGSSDAAHTLMALKLFWSLKLPPAELVAIAATLGSDVPFFFAPPSAICEGRGEIVTPVAPPAAAWAVLILPSITMPTPAVFRRFDALAGGASFPAPSRGGAEKAAQALLLTLVNDLEAAAFDLCPPLRELHARAETVFGRHVRMSGSGSTLFTLYDTQTHAVAAATDAERELGVSCRPVPLAVGIGNASAV